MIPVVTSILLSAATAAAAAVDYAPRTVVAYNENSPDSRRLAEAYARARKIPSANLVPLRAAAVETISREEFVSTIESPLREAFSKRGWWTVAEDGGQGRTARQNSKSILTLIHGVPLKIAEQSQAGAPAPALGQQNQASVDSELTLLGVFERSLAGALKNPCFGQDKPFIDAALPIMMLVGRIDGPTTKICERVIADSIAVETTGLCGRAYLDLARKGPGYEDGDQWILSAGQVLGAAGWPVIIDAHAPTLPLNYPMTEAAVYFGWWIRNVDGPFLNPAFRFRRGAVACHMHSFAAETVRSDAAELGWSPAGARGGRGSRNDLGALSQLLRPRRHLHRKVARRLHSGRVGVDGHSGAVVDERRCGRSALPSLRRT